MTDTTLPPVAARRRGSLISFLRRVRTDQLLLYRPSIFTREIGYQRLFLQHAFLLNRPDYIEHVLLANHRNYSKSRYHRQILGPVLGNGLLTSEGDFWRRQRRIAAPAFHHRRIAGFVDSMAQAAGEMLVRWDGRDGPFEITREMMALTLVIIARTMFSSNVGADIAKVERAMTTMLELGKPSLIDLFGLPEWLPRPLPRGLRRAKRDLDEVIGRILAERRADPADRGDLLSMLLAARDEESGEGMSDRQLRDEIMTIFLAGHETTANALAWTWYLLARHPEVEARLHTEVDRVLGGRVPAFADLANLTYVRQVFEESMRLYPPAHTFNRMALGEDEIGGLRIPPGALITISPYVVHRNPALWPDPERFDPDRFAPEKAAGRPRYAYIPFGGGPRICIGNSFALFEAQVIIAMVAQRYRLALEPGHVVEPVGHITMRPKNGIMMRLLPRPA
ncbi:MAG: cytochrome P450 [Alphaproteobacteria bacterium]|nr:cytochrome P450 [Alphaproteobacteria bacterium]